MKIDVNVKAKTVQDLKDGNWFVLLDKPKSVWMLFTLPTIMARSNTTSQQFAIKVAHIYEKSKTVSDKEEFVVPIGTILQPTYNTPVLILNHENSVVKMEELVDC